MDKRTCPVCSELIPEQNGRGRPRKFCSTSCRKWFYRHMVTPVAPPPSCTHDDCSQPRRAKGLCATHYNREHQPDRHKKVVASCSACGKIVAKRPDSRRRFVCSYECRYVLVYGKPKQTDALVHVGPAVPTERNTTPPVNVVKGTRLKWVGGECEWCGDRFVKTTTGTLPRCCSEKCARKYHRARRDLEHGRFQASPARRRRLYERDNWTCQICAEPIDREAHYLDDWAPSLDHIVPQSHTLIPDHSDENLRTAHRWCNSVRGDLSHYTDADLIGAA